MDLVLQDLNSSKKMPKKKAKVVLAKTYQKPLKKRFQNNSIVNKIIGFVLIIIALFILSFHFPATKNLGKNPIEINSKLLESEIVLNIPDRILIPKSNIDLKVIPSRIVNGYWELSEDTASYGLGSGTPDAKSNTVIFAHAREGLFYNLKNVKIGEIVYVFSKDKWFRYKINKITTVYPNEIQVIQPTKNETLTLYTCSGFYDEKRLIVTALPQK